jgi:diguanylate cyclase
MPFAEIALVDGEAVAAAAGIGIAVYPDHAADAVGLVTAADVGMYAGKRAGRGRISSAGSRADAA